MRRSILPRALGCLLDREFERLHHLDLAGMSARETWAEAIVAERELACRIASGERDSIIGWDGDRQVTAEAWLRERIHQCRRKVAA